MTTMRLGRFALRLFASVGLLTATYHLATSTVWFLSPSENSAFYVWTTTLPAAVQITLFGLLLESSGRVAATLFPDRLKGFSLGISQLTVVTIALIGISLLADGVAGFSAGMNPGAMRASIHPTVDASLVDLSRGGRISGLVNTALGVIVLSGVIWAKGRAENAISPKAD